MKMLKGILLAVTVTFLIAATALAAEESMHQDVKVDYSADEYMETESVTVQSRVYRSPGKERKEQEMGGNKMTIITRMDKKVSWTLMPEQKMYMENKIGEAKEERAGSMEGYKIEQETVGEEVIDGIKTTKNKVIMTDPKGNKLGGFMWSTKEGIMLKMDVIGKTDGKKMRMKSGLTNLKIEKQDPALFEIPAGYSKMSIPGMGGFNMKDMMKGIR